MSSVLPPRNSLVKYDSPQVVSTKDPRMKGRRTAESKSNVTPTEDILNSILPPCEWTDEGLLWVQYVSSTPATRSDVITLQDHLDLRLQQRQARETGICPIREELYAQCFDELIRQVTINCAERGLLLLRVRDEIRMTIACYQTLYDSSIAFGMRKALQSEQNKIDMQKRIKQLESECRDLHRNVTDLQQKCEMIEKKESDRRAEEAQKHKDEVDFLQKHNQSLKSELERLLSIPSASSGAGADAAGAHH